MNILDLNRSDFNAAIGELAAQGVDVSGLRQQYREKSSPFAGLFDYANRQQDRIADAGRTSIAGGLLSKPEGSTGMDAVRGVEFEPMAFLSGLLSGGAQAVDAPAAAMRGDLTRAEMPGEALGTAGVAMLGGGAVTRPAGSVGMGGFEDYLSRVNPAARRVADEDRPNLMMGDMYGMLPRGSEVVGERGDTTFFRSSDGNYYATAYNPDVGEQDVVGYIMGRGDSTELQVVDEMKGKGIGGELQYLFRSENPDAPTGGLTEAGERSLERTYDRLFDEGIVSANASKSAGLLGVASDVADRGDQVLNMLKSGRGSDVTDEMLDMGDSVKNTQLNQYLFENYDLPMDEASRMARAREMGLTDDQYHATKANFANFLPSETGLSGRGVYAGDYPADVLDYATEGQGRENLSLMPIKTPSSSAYARNIDWQNTMDADEDFPYNANLEETIAGFKRAADTMHNQGYAGVHNQPGERVTFDPRDTRSRFARFDPRLSHLSNLNAANASPTAGLLSQAGMSEQQAERTEKILQRMGLLD